jgi:hypothetical protein
LSESRKKKNEGHPEKIKPWEKKRQRMEVREHLLYVDKKQHTSNVRGRNPRKKAFYFEGS